MKVSKQSETIAIGILQTIPIVMRHVAAELRRLDSYIAPVHLSILSILNETPCNLSLLAEQHAVSLPTMSSTVSKMVAQELITRKRSLHDRRMVELQIAPAGRELLLRVGAQMVGELSSAMKELSAAELTALTTGLGILHQLFAPE